MRPFVCGCIAFIKKEVVLCAAAFLALLSLFFVPPSGATLSYIDWDTLAQLFSLMAVMKGFQRAGLFLYLGNRLLRSTATTRKMLLVLVLLPFAFSMVITNDVALITFVPLGITVLRMAKQERLLVPMVVLQTVAANLGSMLTPMGNPQNLYLYAQSGLGFGDFCLLTLPYVLISGGCLAVLAAARKSAPVARLKVPVRLESPRSLLCCALGFLLCLLGLFQVVPPLVVAAVTAAFLLIKDRRLLAAVDYSLLGTFAAFFIFVGNLGCVEAFRDFLASVLTGRVELVAVLTSQVISNVPAALLLSGFTDQWRELVVGCNLGGLGTLIASMASLISYKMVAKEYPSRCRQYIAWFTLCNLGLLGLLLLVSAAI